MITCYGCPYLTHDIDGAGFGTYRCSKYPGIIKAEQNPYLYDHPVPFNDCEWGPKTCPKCGKQVDQDQDAREIHNCEEIKKLMKEKKIG